MKKALTILAVFIFGFFVSDLLQQSSAHNSDPTLLHGCVRNILKTVRIVGPNDACNNNETPHDWKEYNPADEVPFICPNCNLDTAYGFDSIVKRLKSKNLVNSYLDQVRLDGADLSNTNMTNVFAQSGTFTGSNLSGALFTNGILSHATFNAADATNSVWTNADITSVNFTDTNLTGASGLNITGAGVIWSNTTCPDGTNSDNNGNTCEGHL